MAKVILVTGASAGMGKATAELLIQNGHIVYGTCRNPEYVDFDYKMLAMDLNDQDSIKIAIDTIVRTEGRLDVVINNAGVGITGPLEEIPMAEISKNFDTNVMGAIAVMQNALPQMRLQKSGLIINITSIAGYVGLPYRSIYSATKAALHVLTESLRMEVKRFNINVVNIAPGDFATGIASRRFHTPINKDSAYAKSYAKTLDRMDKSVDGGSNPEEMARFIARLIDKKSPGVHYKVGAPMQKFSIVLKRILPDKVFEYLLFKYFKL